VKEAFILSKKGRHTGPISRLAVEASPAPTPPPVKEFRRPSVCSGVDPLRPLFQQVSALPRNRFLDFDNLSLSDDFAQLISSPQFENLVQSFVILKQKTLEVNISFFIYMKIASAGKQTPKVCIRLLSNILIFSKIKPLKSCRDH
jgi:hypothetical protein